MSHPVCALSSQDVIVSLMNNLSENSQMISNDKLCVKLQHHRSITATYLH